MILDSVLDIFRGKALTIPPMDGALKPNTSLESAKVVADVERPDSIAADGSTVIYAAGNSLWKLGNKKPLHEYQADITALAVSDKGHVAVGLESGTILVDGEEISGFNCPTALAFDGDSLLVCNGSAAVSPGNWVTDLMRRGTTGSVWRIDLAAKNRVCLAQGLAYPYGVMASGGRIVFSESWRHRLLSVSASGGAPSPVLQRLPAYPCRIVPTEDGSLLACFAPLNRLVEFVLREDDYREDMMREIESRYWIAPTLSASHSFLEPLQNGGVRSMGVHKPWSPSRSCGLLIRLDRDFRPVASFHSRADGHNHGITSAVEISGKVIAVSKGGNVLLELEPGAGAVQ